MKLLYIKSSGFKNLERDCTIDFVAKSKKTSEDREYELQEIADGLFVYNTAAFIGKNASGKTTALELLDCCYSILGDFSLQDKNYAFNNTHLEIIFYHEGKVYKYVTNISSPSTIDGKVTFSEQKLYEKVYRKSKLKQLFEDEGFKPVDVGLLPEDTSVVFFVLKKKATRAVCFNCDGEGEDTYRLMFNLLIKYNIPSAMLEKVIHLFDSNIFGLEMSDEHNYILKTSQGTKKFSEGELLNYLSSGTTKGLLLYVTVIASLKTGFDVLIDEIENHFHKTLVENIISLYKDKAINTHNATLYFTTHYCELLDLFNRQDNIWVCRAEENISLINMYEGFKLRFELSKSKQFYNDAFKTGVNYEELMAIKKEFFK